MELQSFQELKASVDRIYGGFNALYESEQRSRIQLATFDALKSYDFVYKKPKEGEDSAAYVASLEKIQSQFPDVNPDVVKGLIEETLATFTTLLFVENGRPSSHKVEQQPYMPERNYEGEYLSHEYLKAKSSYLDHLKIWELARQYHDQGMSRREAFFTLNTAYGREGEETIKALDIIYGKEGKQ